MIRKELLRIESRRPLIQTLLRTLLKESLKQPDFIVRKYLTRTIMLSFKLDMTTQDPAKIEEFLKIQEDLLMQIHNSNLEDKTSSKYLINLAYGQVVFTPRHDAFLQATYLNKLPFKKTGMRVYPCIHQVHALGNPGLPEEFVLHIKSYIQEHPELKPLYQPLLDF